MHAVIGQILQQVIIFEEIARDFTPRHKREREKHPHRNKNHLKRIPPAVILRSALLIIQFIIIRRYLCLISGRCLFFLFHTFTAAHESV